MLTRGTTIITPDDPVRPVTTPVTSPMIIKATSVVDDITTLCNYSTYPEAKLKQKAE